MDDVDTAVKLDLQKSMSYIGFQRKTMSGLSDSTLTMLGFSYDLDSVRKYAAENHSQAEIMTHVTRSIASTLINKWELVML